MILWKTLRNTNDKLLIDTHILIWFIRNHPQLTFKTKTTIENSEACFVSVASLWEIGIKMSLGKLDLKIGLFAILPINQLHVVKNSDLHFFHKDPFDRILIAQAIIEDLEIITSDSEFLNYPVNTIVN
ncbi:MAG: type II toxin-antitoxin system VapC family toxin [Algoriphagus sp.]|nr:type II toxin-antitoxin system VapC family toxin [Algoriphagus sp.]